jgi:SAM-dependent methyltransferase
MTMASARSVEDIRRRKAEIEARYGPWTAHPIVLAEGVSTLEVRDPNFLLYRRRILQAASDFAGRSLEGLRVLDLGALEGGFAIEFALQGAEAVAVEAREANCRRIEFARDVLGLSDLAILKGDVRDLDPADVGDFDIVLCLGILCHMNRTSIVPFVRNLFSLTRRVLILDTHVALNPDTRMSDAHARREYFGAFCPPHSDRASDEQIETGARVSAAREQSFLLSDASLRNLLADVGFSSSFDCHNPYCRMDLDRRTIVACKSDRLWMTSLPAGQGKIAGRHSEHADRNAVAPVNRQTARWKFWQR